MNETTADKLATLSRLLKVKERELDNARQRIFELELDLKNIKTSIECLPKSGERK